MELDIYFEENYGKIYELNGEGKLETFKMNTTNGQVVYNFLKREIPIKIEISEKNYYDIITPYGYGGPLFSNVKNLEELKKEFQVEFSKYCEENSIVSEFVRFHPIIKNHEMVQDFMEVIYNRDTICIEIESEDKIMENLTSNCRNMIRKGLKNEIEISTEGKLEDFYAIYLKTMDKNDANSYYYFSENFFTNTISLLQDKVKIFSATYEGKVISSAMIIHGGEYMHYHFSGTDPEYRNLAANNLLLYEAIKWGAQNNKKYFHLGGGYLGNGDALYKFKSSFTKKEPLKFYVGKKIHNEKVYGQLVEEVEKSKKIENINYFPLYRG